MPRLTTKQYLRTHDQLRRLWVKNPIVFSHITPTEQWQLHDFFRPDKDWTDLQLLQHRDEVTASRPSLPHQAGRALNRFWDKAAAVGLKQVRAAKAPAAVAAKRVKQQDRHLTVRVVARPEIDTKKLARAYINLAINMQKRRDQDKHGSDGTTRRP